jgi:hypothetical protein
MAADAVHVPRFEKEVIELTFCYHSSLLGLIPDPWDEGGGVHAIAPGGYLKVHTDFPFHRTMRLWRRVNVLLYLNDEWDDSWGGHLELWRSAPVTEQEISTARPGEGQTSVSSSSSKPTQAGLVGGGSGRGGGSTYVPTSLAKRIAPVFNRMVIFNTNSQSFHGHSEPLRSPPGTFRKSIALYYYSSDIDPGPEVMKSTTNFIAVNAAK